MNKYFFTFITLNFFISSPTLLAEEDFAYEKRIHNIYLKHYKVPVSNSDWNNQLQSLSSQHKLKSKDNMWDLSQSFFENPLYWSKMWVVNPQVENPHLIYEGNTLALDPLSLAKVNTSKYSVDIQSQFEGLTVPQSKLTRKSLSESEIPPSLPQLLSFRYTDHQIDSSKMQNMQIQKRAMITSYLSSTTPSVAGEVINKDGYGIISVSGDILVVRIDSTFSIGSIFTVFQNKGRIGSLLQFVTGLTESEVVFKGRIKILSFIKGTDSLYSAIVLEASDQIIPGDSLLKGNPPSYQLSQYGTEGSGSGLIIGSPIKNQELLSIGDIIYLNKGKSDGIQKEDIFYIKKNSENYVQFQRPYQYDNLYLGKLKIIHSANTTSTGIILEARTQILVGDIFIGASGTVEDFQKTNSHESVEDDEVLEIGTDILIEVEEDTEEEHIPSKTNTLQDFEELDEEQKGLNQEEAEDEEMLIDFEGEHIDEEEPGDDLEEEPEDGHPDIEMEEIEEESEDEFPDSEMEEIEEEPEDGYPDSEMEEIEEEPEDEYPDSELEELEETEQMEDDDFKTEKNKTRDDEIAKKFEQDTEDDNPDNELEEFEEIDIL